ASCFVLEIREEWVDSKERPSPQNIARGLCCFFPAAELGVGSGQSGMDEKVVRCRVSALRECRDRLLIAVLEIVGPPDGEPGGTKTWVQAFRDFEVRDRLARPAQRQEKAAAVEISFGIARIEFDGTT